MSDRAGAGPQGRFEYRQTFLACRSDDFDRAVAAVPDAPFDAKFLGLSGHIEPEANPLHSTLHDKADDKCHELFLQIYPIID